MDGLTVGRIVHVRAVRGEHAKCQPAVVVQVWTDEPKAYVNLNVFRDGSNDSKYDGVGFKYAESSSAVPVYDGALGSALNRWATSCYEGQDANEFHDPRACEHTTA